MRLPSPAPHLVFAAALRLLLGLAFLSTLAPVHSPAAAWPAFRGPHRDGSAPAARIPLHFGPDTNVAWQSPTPSGHSSPVVDDGRVFLTGFESNSLLVLAYDLATGARLWRRDLPPGPIESGSRLSHPASATSATDSGRVVSYFAPLGLVAHSRDGNELWRHPLPTPVTQHGASSSPVLARHLALLLVDQDEGSFLLAVDARSGKTAWKTERPTFRRGFSTPLPYPPGNPDQIIVAGTLRLVAYNLADGSERWSVSGLPNEMVASPIAGPDCILVAGWTSGSGVPRMPSWSELGGTTSPAPDRLFARDDLPAGPARHHFAYIDANRDGRLSRAEYETIAGIFDHSRNVALAVRPDGHGDVTATHVLWTQTRGLPYVPTPLFHDGRLYLVRNGGLASALDARTGSFLFQEERLGALGDYYASPVAAGDRVLAISQPGTAVVYQAGDALRVLARNALGEEVLATPAIVDDTLLVRTRTRLFAFRDRMPAHSDR